FFEGPNAGVTPRSHSEPRLMPPLEPPQLGALLQPSGDCLFRVWAPLAPTLRLRLVDDRERLIPLKPETNGDYSTILSGIQPDQRSLYELGNSKSRPDPSSRSQPDGVHAPSVVVESTFAWTDAAWEPPELADYVIYELHVGTFTPAGTFDAAIDELDRLK